MGSQAAALPEEAASESLPTDDPADDKVPSLIINSHFLYLCGYVDLVLRISF